MMSFIKIFTFIIMKRVIFAALLILALVWSIAKVSDPTLQERF